MPTERDPVCGMQVNPESPRGGSARFEGKTYYFCNPRCREKFERDPTAYLSPRPQAPVSAGEYVCPMHPEVKSPHPGACPLCGMALEPVLPGADDEPNPETLEMKRRFLVGAVFTLPIVVLMFAESLVPMT